MDLILWLLNALFWPTLRFDKGGSPPAPPAPVDPSVQIAAQARALPSIFTPQGSRVFSGDPNVAGSFRMDETLAPSQQRQLAGRNEVAEALLGRSNKALSGLPVGYDFRGAEDPTANRFFENQKKLLDRAFDEDGERLEQRLANQGLPMGSEAYTEEMDRFQRGRADSLESAAAEALQLGFGQDIATRQQNLNEVAQALGGSQLQPIGGSGGSPVDPAAAFANQQAGVNRQYQGQLAGYNADVAGQNNLLNGLFGLGAAGIMASDRRLKTDIVLVGEIKPGINLYHFRYRWSPHRVYGVMADEVEKVMPEAVFTRDDGMQLVDYFQVLGAPMQALN